MGSTVLSLRIDGELLDRLRGHAAKRGMSVQDYVLRTLIRDDFDERFKAAVDETEKFYGPTPTNTEATAATEATTIT
ncbi:MULTISPECIES: ribbon-helix-helix protein, CopG family [Streptomyces]|uniref:Ribbon-helix-helix protein, CopG family n=1 Tax=Streptomyces solicathayae TaxID=3081768 RepID=A0ABZ0LW06_9ACTN|nr:ribbon-helix-helix protein, CopG family [Streptomyces sp. HUAS YS2]WOX23679.1 ribbon-helix-helix protein, CopG family [Streptomyces sp. HUAS YS2]